MLIVRAPQLCGRVADKSGPYRVSPEGSPLGRKQRATGLAHRRLSTRMGWVCAQPAPTRGCHGAIRADVSLAGEDQFGWGHGQHSRVGLASNVGRQGRLLAVDSCRALGRGQASGLSAVAVPLSTGSHS